MVASPCCRLVISLNRRPVETCRCDTFLSVYGLRNRGRKTTAGQTLNYIRRELTGLLDRTRE